MKVAEKSNTVEVSGEIIKEHKCSIADMAFAMELLTKHYTEPIKAVCQEILSNARDSHREMGKDDVPICVKLPNSLDPRWICRDYGIGISPERMKDVFVRYGASTKRDDNIQTGGFGIGAKTPWAYSSTFGIETFCPEDEWKDSDGETHYNVMIKRVYIAYIGKDRIGRLSQTVEELTDEPRGTKIIVTAKEDDFVSFRRHTLRCSIFWDVQPEITGVDNFEWPDLNIISSSDNYVLLDTNQEFDNVKFHNEFSEILKRQWMIIDGIPYPFDLSSLASTDYYCNDISLSDGTKISRYCLSNVGLLLFFDVGDLVVSTNREQINYDETDKEVIRKKLTESINNIRNMLQSKIDNAASYLEALKIFGSTSMFGILEISATWKGKKLSKFLSLVSYSWENKARELYDTVYTIRCRAYHAETKTKGDETIYNIKYTEPRNIDPTNKYIFVLQDNYGDPLEKKIIWTILKDNIDHTVVVLDPGSKNQYDIINESISYDLLNPINYSSIDATPIPRFSRNKIVSGKTKTIFTKNYMREVPVYDKKQALDFKHINLQEDKGLYCIYYRNRYYITESDISNNKNINICNLTSKFGIKVYGIKKADIDKLGDKWISLEYFLRNMKNHYIKQCKNKEYVLYEKNANVGSYQSPLAYFVERDFSYLQTDEQKKVLNSIDNKNTMYDIFNFIYNYQSGDSFKIKDLVSIFIFIGKTLSEPWVSNQKTRKEELEKYGIKIVFYSDLLDKLYDRLSKVNSLDRLVNIASIM